MYVAEKKKMIPISRVILVVFEILQIAVHYLETIQNNDEDTRGNLDFVVRRKNRA